MLSDHLSHVNLVVLPLFHLFRHLLVILHFQHGLQVFVLLKRSNRVFFEQLDVGGDHGHGLRLEILVLVGRGTHFDLGRPQRGLPS